MEFLSLDNTQVHDLTLLMFCTSLRELHIQNTPAGLSNNYGFLPNVKVISQCAPIAPIYTSPPPPQSFTHPSLNPQVNLTLPPYPLHDHKTPVIYVPGRYRVPQGPVEWVAAAVSAVIGLIIFLIFVSNMNSRPNW